MVRPPRVKEARAWLECRLVEEKIFKDHIAIFAEVVAAEVLDEIVVEGETDYSKINPILHITKDYQLELKVIKRRKM